MNLPIYVAERNAEAKWAKALTLNISDSFTGVDKDGKIAGGSKPQSLIRILGGSWTGFIDKQNIDLVAHGLSAVEDIADRFMEHMGKKTAGMLKDDVCKFVADKIWEAKHNAGAFSDTSYQHLCNGLFVKRLERRLIHEAYARQSHLIGKELTLRIEASEEILEAISKGCIQKALSLINVILEELINEDFKAQVKMFNQSSGCLQIEEGAE